MKQTIRVVNLSQIAQTPDVILADGTRTQVRVYPRLKCELPAGATLCKRWLGLNPRTVQELAPIKTYVAPVTEGEDHVDS